MQKAGGRLPSLSNPQIPAKIRDNNHEGEYVTPIEGPNNMMNAAFKSEHVSNPTVETIPPAGGSAEQAVGAQVVDFLKSVGVSIPEAKPRTWKDTALEHGIPVARTIAAVLIAEGAVALVKHGLEKRRVRKELAAAEAEAMLAELETNDVG